MRIQSGAARTSLVELYTSEGCSSCPSGEDFVRATVERSEGRLIALAFHVDYWDEIGWPDRFASPRWTARQRSRSASLYTPELMLNGREIDRHRIAPSMEPAHAQLELEVDGSWATIRARGGRRIFLVVTESELSVHVEAGENRGRTLRHDDVVRALYGPFDTARPALQQLALDSSWDRRHLALVAFVENDRGEILNAVRLLLGR